MAYTSSTASAGRAGAHPLAIAAIITSLVGCCLPPIALIGLVLGIIALVKLPNDPLGRGGKALAIVAIVFGLGAPMTLAAIAVPNFVRFQAMAKQSESKANLKALYVLQRSHLVEKDTYTERLDELEWAPESGNRYACFLSSEDSTSGTSFGPDLTRHPSLPGVEVIRKALPRALAGNMRLGLRGTCPECVMTMVCATQLDDDAALDVWSISTANRVSATGESIPAGQPYNERNDLTETEGHLDTDAAPAVAQAPRDSAPVEEEEPKRDDEYRWSTVSADGTAVLSHFSDGQGNCQRSCTDEPSGEVWSAEGCIAKRLDLRFVANDCGKTIVLHQLPEVKVSERERWNRAPVIQVYAREKHERDVPALGAVRQWSAVRSAGTSFYWLAGALGQRGTPPRYSADGNAVEFQTLDGQSHVMSLLSGAGAPTAADVK